MRNTNQKTLRLAQLAILIALEAVLTFTPLGFIMAVSYTHLARGQPLSQADVPHLQPRRRGP